MKFLALALTAADASENAGAAGVSAAGTVVAGCGAAETGKATDNAVKTVKTPSSLRFSRFDKVFFNLYKQLRAILTGNHA